MGVTPDLSPLQFRFYDPISYLDPITRFPKHNEQIGQFIGVVENVESPLTFWIHRRNGQIIGRSNVYPLTPTEVDSRGISMTGSLLTTNEVSESTTNDDTTEKLKITRRRKQKVKKNPPMKWIY